MAFEKELQDIGLHRSEIQVYTHLLENGLCTPPQIAKITKIARSNCYNILQSLKEKGLILEQKNRGRKAYIASDPEALLRSIEQKKETLTRILPDLRALHATQKNKPKIRFFEGFEQVKEIYWEATSAEKLFAIGSTKYITDRDPQFFNAFQHRLRNRGIFLQDIITNPSQEVGLTQTQEILGAFYDFHLLPEKYKDFPTDLLIWNDNIALITLQEPIFGTVISNSLLAQTFRYIFEIIWEGSKQRL